MLNDRAGTNSACPRLNTWSFPTQTCSSGSLPSPSLIQIHPRGCSAWKPGSHPNAFISLIAGSPCISKSCWPPAESTGTLNTSLATSSTTKMLPAWCSRLLNWRARGSRNIHAASSQSPTSPTYKHNSDVAVFLLGSLSFCPLWFVEVHCTV